jgi:hypothetical protein
MHAKAFVEKGNWRAAKYSAAQGDSFITGLPLGPVLTETDLVFCPEA